MYSDSGVSVEAGNVAIGAKGSSFVEINDLIISSSF